MAELPIKMTDEEKEEIMWHQAALDTIKSTQDRLLEQETEARLKAKQWWVQMSEKYAIDENFRIDTHTWELVAAPEKEAKS